MADLRVGRELLAHGGEHDGIFDVFLVITHGHCPIPS